MRRSSNAGRHAAQLCEICMEWGSELRCSGSEFTASSCIRRQSESIAPIKMERALEITAISRPGAQLGPCIQTWLAASTLIETPKQFVHRVVLAGEDFAAKAAGIKTH